MSVFKCKMCGGTIEFEEGSTVGVCDSCGTKQTLPRLDSERKANLYDRADHFRRNNDFDKAAGIYEQILNEDNSDAEAYWSLVLCRYGIEYVEDPSTHKRIPTVNRAQFTSIFDDEDYKSALKYADILQRVLYEEEANTINEIQKGILAISQNEEPFDVFICYKETDNNGRRTPDSVLANDLYHQLTQEGFKVFFSRITLEDKLGTAYEPYIFAALNSAKVMVVLGTRPEYFNAVWVKNEWSRYLALVKQSNGKKVLIPAYRDMDPYDLPEEFSHLQAQDMSKLGFMQDLIRGIKKITQTEEKTTSREEVVVNVGGSASVAPLLRRAFMFLEDAEWDKADDFCEQVLNQEPESVQAYLGKLMAELKVRTREELADCSETFYDSSNYQKVIRFGDDLLRTELQGYNKTITQRNELNRLTRMYNSALSEMEAADSEEEYKRVADRFGSIGGFRDSEELVTRCLDLAERARKDAVYEKALSRMKGNSKEYYEAAIKTLQTIPDWKDSEQQIEKCYEIIEGIRQEEERERIEREKKAEQDRLEAERAEKRRNTYRFIGALAVVILIVVAAVWVKVVVPNREYSEAIFMYESGDYEGARIAFSKLGDYKDSGERLKELYVSYLEEAEVGSKILFGNYNQLNRDKDPIEWVVLAKENDRILVISKYVLAARPYNTNDQDITWEKCSLRSWLNSTFMNTAFNSTECAMIPTVTVSADKNPEYSTDPGNDTQDQMFLISIAELEKYLYKAIDCSATDYAYSNGVSKHSNGKCTWWLRTPGRDSTLAATVDADGNVGNVYVFISSVGVRPVMWIDFGE